MTMPEQEAMERTHSNGGSALSSEDSCEVTSKNTAVENGRSEQELAGEGSRSDEELGHQVQVLIKEIQALQQDKEAMSQALQAEKSVLLAQLSEASRNVGDAEAAATRLEGEVCKLSNEKQALAVANENLKAFSGQTLAELNRIKQEKKRLLVELTEAKEAYKEMAALSSAREEQRVKAVALEARVVSSTEEIIRLEVENAEMRREVSSTLEENKVLAELAAALREEAADLSSKRVVAEEGLKAALLNTEAMQEIAQKEQAQRLLMEAQAMGKEEQAKARESELAVIAQAERLHAEEASALRCKVERLESALASVEGEAQQLKSAQARLKEEARMSEKKVWQLLSEVSKLDAALREKRGAFVKVLLSSGAIAAAGVCGYLRYRKQQAQA